MRKYLQITVVLLIFGVIALHRHIEENQDVSEIKVGNTTSVNSSLTISPTPIISQSPSLVTPTVSGLYKDGTFTGSNADAFYGIIQVQAVIRNGKIADVIFLQYPNDNQTSRYVNTQAMPILKQEAIQAQNAQVDIVSGASDSSIAFRESLSNALAQAK